MNGQFRALLMFLIVVIAFMAMVLMLTGCTIEIEKVQIGPAEWPSSSETVELEITEHEKVIE